VVAAERLGIALRKLTRERFTTYRDICIPIEGQARGYVVSERALDAFLARQRER
jgi:flavin-dependent dehydrogenase